MIELTDERGRAVYISREAIAVLRETVTKETNPQGHTAVMLMSGQNIFVEESIKEVLAKIEKTS